MKNINKILLYLAAVFVFTMLAGSGLYAQIAYDKTGTASHNLGILRWDTETTPRWNSYRMYYPNGQQNNELHRRRDYHQMMLDYVEYEGATPKDQVEKTWGRTGGYGTRHDYIVRHTPPAISVDGVQLSPPFTGIVDEDIVSDIIFDQQLVFWDYTGGFITIKSYSYANQYHNSYIIFDTNYEFELENIASGSVLPEQTLHMYHMNYWLPEGMGRGIRTYRPGGWGNRCRSYVTGGIFPSALKAAGKITGSKATRDEFVVSYDISADQLAYKVPRALYGSQWSSTYPDFYDRGLPVGNEEGAVEGELTNHASTGFALLYAPKSVDDKSDDVNQPVRLWRDAYATPTRNHILNPVRIDPHPWEQGYEDPMSQMGTSWMQCVRSYQFMGPYYMDPGDEVNYIQVYAVGGLSQEVAWEKGDAYMRWYRDGDGDFDTVKLDELMDTVMDSLIQNIDRAYFAYSKDYDIPDPLAAPDISVTSGPGVNYVSWGYSSTDMFQDHDTGTDDFGEWRVYRKLGNILVNHTDDLGARYDYELVYSTTNKNETEWTDNGVVKGQSYHYFVTAVDDGSQYNSVGGIFDTPQKLESSPYSNRTLQSVVPFEAGLSTSDEVLIVPNPYSSANSENVMNYPGNLDDIHFVNLPPYCTLKIYTATGDLIKTLEHTSGSGQEIWKDMRTDSNQRPVSGVYILVIDNAKDLNNGPLPNRFYKFVIVR